VHGDRRRVFFGGAKRDGIFSRLFFIEILKSGTIAGQNGNVKKKKKGLQITENLQALDFVWCLGRELNSHNLKDRGILSPYF
jgi:hypothetical protein